MSMSKLTTYVEKELKKGFSKEQITRVLLKYQYDQEDIDQAFSEVGHHEFPQHTLEKPHMGKMMFGIVMVIIISLALFFSIQAVQEKSPEFTFNTVDLNKITKERELKWEEYQKKTEEILESSPCSDVEEEQERDICLLKLAAQTGEEKYCDPIESYSIGGKCRKKIWQSEEDTCKYLEAIGEDSSVCYGEKAVQEDNMQVCDYANNHTICLNTYLEANPDIKRCRGESHCIIMLALLKDDISLCRTTGLHEHSELSCVERFAIKEGLKPVCATDTYGKKACKYLI